MKKTRDQSYEHYLSLYQKWKQGNLPVNLFCEQESIPYSTFRYWVKKFESSSPVAAGFTEIRLDHAQVHASGAPIGLVRFATGTTLSLHEWPDAAWLKALL